MYRQQALTQFRMDDFEMSLDLSEVGSETPKSWVPYLFSLAVVAVSISVLVGRDGFVNFLVDFGFPAQARTAASTAFHELALSFTPTLLLQGFRKLCLYVFKGDKLVDRTFGESFGALDVQPAAKAPSTLMGKFEMILDKAVLPVAAGDVQLAVSAVHVLTYMSLCSFPRACAHRSQLWPTHARSWNAPRLRRKKRRRKEWVPSGRATSTLSCRRASGREQTSRWVPAPGPSPAALGRPQRPPRPPPATLRRLASGANLLCWAHRSSPTIRPPISSSTSS